MRAYWNERARENAAWYVDTTVDYDRPDMQAFFEAGAKILDEALTRAPTQPRRRGTAVEIGSGLGRICASLSDQFDRVIGIVVSAEMVQRAQALVSKPNVSFVVGNGEDLSGIQSRSADFVVTFTVLQHLPSGSLIEGYLREAARILAPGGVLAAQWNNLPHPHFWRARARWWRFRNRVGGPLAVGPRADRHFVGTRLPEHVVRQTLTDAGLSIHGTKGLGTLFAWVWASKPLDSG
jgi:SAM-dependent methyltransferase